MPKRSKTKVRWYKLLGLVGDLQILVDLWPGVKDQLGKVYDEHKHDQVFRTFYEALLRFESRFHRQP